MSNGVPSRIDNQYNGLVTDATKALDTVWPDSPDAREVAEVVLDSVDLKGILDRLDWLSEVEHHHVTHGLMRGEARHLVRQLAGTIRLFTNEALTEERRGQVRSELDAVLKVADRAIGVDR